jgi:hypothetical protein
MAPLPYCECKGSNNLYNLQILSAFSLIFSQHLHVIQNFAVTLHRILARKAVYKSII